MKKKVMKKVKNTVKEEYKSGNKYFNEVQEHEDENNKNKSSLTKSDK